MSETKTTPLPPNKEGATPCIVRWQVETDAGWLGAYTKAAFEAYDTQSRADLEAENKRLREALEQIKATKPLARAMKSDWCPAATGMVRVASAALERNHE